MKSNLNSYISAFNRFIGLKSNSNLFSEEKEFILNEIKICNCNPEILDKYNLFNNDVIFEIENQIFFPESLMATYINKLIHYLLDRGKNLISVTLSYPDYFSLSEIEGYVRSLKIANIDTYHIISEQTASNLKLM